MQKPLHQFRITLKEDAGDKSAIVFDCHASDEEHAYEQAEKAYPSSDPATMNCVDIGVIDPDYWRASLVPGSAVFWSDPDNGVSSGNYVLEEIFGEIYHLKNDAGSHAEVFLHELLPPQKVVRLQMVLDVSYLPNGVSTEQLIANLSSMLDYAIGNGMLTGETAAEVQDYESTVQRSPEPLSEEVMADFMLQRIEEGQIELGEIPVRLARYGMMNPVSFQIEMQERIENSKHDA